MSGPDGYRDKELGLFLRVKPEEISRPTEGLFYWDVHLNLWELPQIVVYKLSS